MRFFRQFFAPVLLATAAPLIAQPAQQASSPSVPQGLLPTVAAPSAYRIDLTIVPERERFSGHVEIDIDVKEASQSLFIHGRDLAMHKVAARVGRQVIAASYAEVDSLGVARLDFARPLPAGKATLVFDYDAPFGASPSGLYRVKVADKWYAWTQFQSIDARAAFPGFDEPGHKTPFTVSLTAPAGQTALTNAPQTGEETVGTLVKHSFAPTLPLPTYLMAFVVGPMAVAEGSVAPTPERAKPLPVRVVATEPNSEKLAFALENTGPIVTLLERYFGTPFPFPKLDQIASPVMQGAMENAGADIYGDPILLLGKIPPVGQQQLFGMVVAHELAHQWFGDLVTPKWWDDLWLNESFANWMGYRIGDEWRPDLKIGVGAIDEAFQAMNTDALTAGRPIRQPIKSNAEIDSAFDAVTYGKGGQVVSMIASYLGDEKFRNGVRLHMDRHAYGSASSEDFFASLAEAAGDPRIVEALKSFVHQQGVPVVKLARATNGLTVSQSRYHLLGSQVPAQSWLIPLCVKLGEARQCSLLDRPTATLPLTGAGAIMPNADGTGYYRFSLDEAEWVRLIEAGPGLEPGEALALNDSLWADMRAGHAAPSLLVKAARSMAGHAYSEAATEAGDRLAGLRRRGLFPGKTLDAYKATLDAIYAPMLAELGFDPRAGAYAADDPDRRARRGSLVSLLAGEAKDKGVRDTLVAAMKADLAGDAGALDLSFLSAALGAYVAQGGQAVAGDLFTRALASEDTVRRGAMLSALAGSGDPAIAQWLISRFGQEGLRPTDTLRMVRGMASEPATRALAIDWLVANYDSVVTGAGIFAAASLPGITQSGCSAAEADRAEAALRPKVVQYQRGALELDRAIEQIRACAALRTARGREIASMFD
ncbi:putative M1 family peptidase [Sphingobium sp. SYK-6]|uniref:M1 family metallopeptidase n=1 Tax=Sphingobium sp. (strain NBRC 103272 / SYK-6) TaxID=627192 RepID=UPI0002276B3D|nr:M1 family metallopeptidase [Sphingobium sp. SYK-6]BAK64842.1 putative M1 family peptidase [Sphingobium sp. SYK-6]